ncbi:hypothetical protein WG907_03845 [Sphingobium sp. AN558]|uniref:hypothetical protein n=1 Tax=Sphingobium sp. AN558 TaxID=3133442 RepID=UPI0030C25415
MRAGLVRRIAGLAEARAARLREAIALAMIGQGVEQVAVEDERVRLSGRGLMRRWMNDLALRGAGRGER